MPEEGLMEKIVIVGVGALGSHLALLLRNLSSTLVLCDNDRVEKKNTLSQFHTVMGVGKNKAIALQQTLQGLFATKTTSSIHRLTSDNVHVILADAALVIDCTDNAKTRRLIQAFTATKNIPCLHGCLGADGTIGRVVWSHMFRADDELEGAVTCEDGEFLPFIVLVSSYLALAVQKFIKTGERWAFHVLPDKTLKL
jgi:hypothetical protein